MSDLYDSSVLGYGHEKLEWMENEPIIGCKQEHADMFSYSQRNNKADSNSLYKIYRSTATPH